MKSGGSVLIFDKFLQPEQKAPLRQLINPLLRRLATRLNVVFEVLLEQTPQLVIESDQPALAAGWLRLIRLRRIQCRLAFLVLAQDRWKPSISPGSLRSRKPRALHENKGSAFSAAKACEAQPRQADAEQRQ